MSGADVPDTHNLSRMIDERRFRTTLIVERKRADRSNRPLGLLIVAVNDAVAAGSSATWAAAIVAVETVIRGIDRIGWVESRRAIGVLFPELRGSSVDARDLEERVRLELSRRLPSDTVPSLSIQFHQHSAHKRVAEQGASALDFSLFPELEPRHQRRTAYSALKRALDILGSLMLLVLLSPLFLLIAVLVKATSPGPVFFRQQRIGQMMKPFTMFKFRTMHVNADEAVHHEYVSWFIQASGRTNPGDCRLFKLTNDKRITAIGHLLRSTSLDELPQFWNVLRGQMSLVGPRPPLPYELEQYRSWHCRRVLEAKPGITGLWQVAGRSRTTFDDMVRLDLRYAKTCSFWNDIRILLATPAAVFSGKGAC